MSAGMGLWVAVVLGCLAVFALKYIGYRLPEHWLADERVARTAGLVTTALLAALVVLQTFTTGRDVVVDARLPALVVAALALALRVPFLGVIVLAAATAAGVRALGWLA